MHFIITILIYLSIGANSFICPLPNCVAKEDRLFSENHRAVDLEASVGVPVYASQNGTVYKAGWNYSTNPPALAVTILHGDGTVATNYWHLSEVFVKAGDRVRQGQQIGLTGLTGTTSWPHLHFSMQINREHIDPTAYVEVEILGQTKINPDII